MYFLLAAAVLAVGLYFLFKDTMNRLQYVATLRIYWVTKNNAVEGTPLVSRARMYHTAPPWWQGKGIQFRFRNYTFHFGVLTGKAENLLQQLGGRDLDVGAKELRNWGRRNENKTV